MMESMLSSASDMIDTSTIMSSQSERSSPVTVAEFDGETVLCRVCGDRASGFHYGVHACEGCKGFFRRSIQQKIQYRPCLKNQQCNIQRVNRNRCQYCRLKKCISVGMSRDAVRFGRVPKKEKARIIEQMQKKNMASQSSELNSLLANNIDIVHAIVTSHRHTCDITQFRAHQMRDLALHKQEFVNCPANMACPLNNEIAMDTNANRHNLTDISESFTPAIKSVVDFAKGIPGFILLNQDDQVTLLKAGTFEVLLVRLACLFDPNSNTMMFTGGKLYKRQASTMTTNAGFLLDSMFDFAERFNKMCLIDDEIALFSAVVLMSPDRPGIRNVEQVDRIQNKLTEALQNIINANHKEDGTLFAKLLMKTTDLRTLNTLHSEKSIAGQKANLERKERQNGDDLDMEFQESVNTRSGVSSPTLSDTSNVTMTSGFSGDTDSNNIVVGQRLPLEASSHQQVVLRTPYGTFFREEMSGFYGMMADQPRRRCNTLDRDTLTRPRLHTIEEGSRRRYTLDRDYINRMVNRLSDRLETRNAVRGDSVPTSISSSAASSPIQEEGSGLYPAPHSASFTPINVPDGAVGHSSVNMSRTSPLANSEAMLAAAARAGSSPASPKSRSRSGSFSQDEYANMRPRCYSFHLNSEGRAARMSLQHRMMVDRREEADQILPDGSGQYLSPDMRRGSVGTAYGLHSRKQSLLVDRPLSYVTRGPEMEKRAASTAPHGISAMKHMMPDGPLYGMAAQHPGLWHQQAALAMGMTPPMSMPLMQRPRDDLSRPLDSRSREWDVAKTLSRELPREILQRDLNRKPMGSEVKETTGVASSQVGNKPDQDVSKSADEKIEATAHSPLPLLQDTGAVNTTAGTQPREEEVSDISTSHSTDAASEGQSNGASTGNSEFSNLDTDSKNSSAHGSPNCEEMSMETFGHKKFDKFRKEKGQPDAGVSSAIRDEGDIVKAEKMEEDDENELHDGDMRRNSVEDGQLKVELSEVKVERKSPGMDRLSPASSNSSCPSPSNERPKLSAKEAHPNLLAHLMNGGSKFVAAPPSQPPHPKQATATAKTSPTSSPMASSRMPLGFPWQMIANNSNHLPPHLQPFQQQQQMFKHPMFNSQSNNSHPGMMPSPNSAWTGSSPQQTSSHSGSGLHSQCSSSDNPQSASRSLGQPPNIDSMNRSNSNCNINNSSSSSSSSSNDQLFSNSKEEFHAAAVSHLKDKLLRKFDSMENLHKVGKDATPLSGSQWPSTSSCSPAVKNAISSSSTADLNNELATKLTLSSTIPSSATLTMSSQLSSSSSSPPSSIAYSQAVATGSRKCPGSVSSCPSSSSTLSMSGAPLCAAVSPSSSSASSTSLSSSSTKVSSVPEPASPFLPHPAAMSQLLLSQGIHPSSLPMYHSMLSRQYPTLATPPAMGLPPGHNALPPLANMQHFAQMFARSQAASGHGADRCEKRMDLGAPLNLTSRMEEGSSSPSHSSQTPA